jgi:hypothetical protein
MASGHMTDGIGHRHDAQPECQRHTDQTDTNLWKRGGDNRAAAAPQMSAKTSRSLRRHISSHHSLSPERRLTISKQSEAEFVDHQFTTHCRASRFAALQKALPNN